MNDYGQDLDFEIIIPKLKGTTSIQIFKSLSEQAAAHLGVSASALFDLMIKKEEEASSGIGGGVAIPHVQASGPKKSLTILATLNTPVDFNAADGEAADLIGLVISPERDGPIHLRRLARISRLLRCDDLHKKLVEADDVATIRSLLIDPEGWLMAA